MGQAIFVRQKTIHCGKNYREVDLIPYTAEQKRKDKAGRKRARKEKVSTPTQKNLNDKNAVRAVVQLGYCNFGVGDLKVDLTYDPKKYIPSTIEEAELNCWNFIRRLNYKQKKLGLPPLKYIATTSQKSGKDGTPVHAHHHLIIGGDMDRDMVEEAWGYGYARTRRIKFGEDMMSGLLNYMAKQAGGKKRWSSSHGLIRPYATNNDSSWSNRTVDKLGREKPGREYWERKFPGWTLINDDYGKEYIYNEVTATWSVYLKMRRNM